MLPYCTSDLPGAGGACPPRSRQCTELLTANPGGEAGENGHWWVQVRKVGLGTTQARQAVARAARCSEDLVACAGHRDRQAAVVQWLSVPARVVDHPNQLKLAGAHGKLTVVNVLGCPRPVTASSVDTLRWSLRIEGAPGTGYLRAKAVLDRLRRLGLANYIDPVLVTPELVQHGRQVLAGRRAADPSRARWAVQAWLFNAACAERVHDGLLGSAIPGDLVADAARELHLVADPGSWRGRLDNHDAHPTGPWFGGDMPAPAAAAAEREERLIDAFGVAPAALASLPGGHRRAYRIQPRQVQVLVEGSAIRISCDLPAETHIAVLLREVLKEADLSAPPPDDAPEE
ncbi:tRNA pseudouridine synthase D [Planctomycetota bacterium]|nr:tRNA pseudouridine synthase D [Planctomycetota bacterium]